MHFVLYSMNQCEYILSSSRCSFIWCYSCSNSRYADGKPSMPPFDSLFERTKYLLIVWNKFTSAVDEEAFANRALQHLAKIKLPQHALCLQLNYAVRSSKVCACIATALLSNNLAVFGTQHMFRQMTRLMTWIAWLFTTWVNCTRSCPEWHAGVLVELILPSLEHYVSSSRHCFQATLVNTIPLREAKLQASLVLSPGRRGDEHFMSRRIGDRIDSLTLYPNQDSNMN